MDEKWIACFSVITIMLSSQTDQRHNTRNPVPVNIVLLEAVVSGEKIKNMSTNQETLEVNQSVKLQKVTVDVKKPFDVFRQVKRVSKMKPDAFIADCQLCREVYMSGLWGPFNHIPLLCSQQSFAGQTSATGETLCRQKGKSTETKCPCVASLEKTLDSTLKQVFISVGWKSVAVFHDKENGPSAKALVKELAFVRTRSLLYSMDIGMSPKELSAIILTSYTSLPKESRNFLILCEGVLTRRILKQADMFDDKVTGIHTLSSWLLVLPLNDKYLVETMGIELDNVASLFLPIQVSKTSSEALCYHILGACQHMEEYIGRPKTSLDWKFLLGKLRLDIAECENVEIHTLLHKKTGRTFSIVGNTRIGGKVTFTSKVFPNKLSGFNKRKLLASHLVWSPFVLREYVNKSAVYMGLCADLLKQLSVSLNFTYDVVEPSDGEFGGIINGTWTGLVGQLARKEVDLVVAPLTVTRDREKVMDFIYPFYHDSGAGIFKMPDISKLKWKIFLQPFRWEVFVCLAVTFVSVTVLLFALDRIANENREGNSLESFQDTLWYTFGTFLKYGGTYRPVHQPPRIVIGALWLFCIMICAGFCGRLVGILAVTKFEPPFTTLADVTSQSHYRWGTIGGSMWINLFKSSNLTVYQNIWEGMKQFNSSSPDILSTSETTHRKMVETGSYVHFFDGDLITLWAAENCNLMLLEETFFQITYAVGLPEASPYTQIFSEVMLDIEQSGLLQLWKQRWWPKASNCADKFKVVATKIGIADMQSAFYVLFTGLLGASLVLCCEKGYWNMFTK